MQAVVVLTTLCTSTNRHIITTHLMGSICSQLTNSTTSSKMPTPTDKQAEVILAGCGAPKRGMGWYHAVQLLKGKCPSAVLCHVIEPWFLGGGTSQLSVDCCSHLLKLFGRCALAVKYADRTKVCRTIFAVTQFCSIAGRNCN